MNCIVSSSSILAMQLTFWRVNFLEPSLLHCCCVQSLCLCVLKQQQTLSSVCFCILFPSGNAETNKTTAKLSYSSQTPKQRKHNSTETFCTKPLGTEEVHYLWGLPLLPKREHMDPRTELHGWERRCRRLGCERALYDGPLDSTYNLVVIFWPR